MHESSMQRYWNSSHISGGNAAYVEELYEQFLHNPEEVPEEWRTYFSALPQDGGAHKEVSHASIRAHFLQLAKDKQTGRIVGTPSADADHEVKQVRVLALVESFRHRGHQRADTDPIKLRFRPDIPDLTLSFHGLSPADLDTEFRAGSLFIGRDKASLREILQILEETYCSTIGAEFMHIVDSEQQRWFQSRLESVRAKPLFSPAARLHVLERMTAAEGLEKYLGSRYPGTKRFGLEGGESLVPLVDELIQRAGQNGVKEMVVGMAHRGRLNLLVNILGKNPKSLFEEFEGKQAHGFGSGDVKYHQGFSSHVMTPGGQMHLAMAFNPSHLEIVSPVVEGSVRARQDRRGDADGRLVIPLAIHGDAAFAGQGVVMETLQMSQTRGFKTGGTVHIIINNQVGFTTSRPEDARSTEYCTDVAKMVEAPVLHVNGDDPEAVVCAAKLALDFRMEFKKDVVIDLVCYRRRGHNEADEPSGTQPVMYQKIGKQKTSRNLYADRLVDEGVLSTSASQQLVEDYRQALDDGAHVAKSLASEPDVDRFVNWEPYVGQEWNSYLETGVPLERLQRLGHQMTLAPDGFAKQRQVRKIYEDRRKMAAGALAINWGMAETLAYATLLDEDYPIRLTGQDVGRGTFSHRHAVLHDQNDGHTYIPLADLSEDQPRFQLYDSLLSEEAVLAFEYGYATTTPRALLIWEAQFGDFANGAQVVIDQFLVSGEHKWGRLCGLTLLLPHGYEGQGPEHSSARPERFLQLCAEHNIQVCMPTTPAQVFHMLRRQVLSPLRKPLVVFSPKSLLRHKRAVSSLDDLASGGFQPILADRTASDPDSVKRLVMCSGKVYYDLSEKQRQEELDGVAIVRIEQLYPFPEEELAELIKGYSNLEHIVWCQEEPMNQGAWYCSQHHMRRAVTEHPNSTLYLDYAGREASAAPACGHMTQHVEQQKQLVIDALGINQ